METVVRASLVYFFILIVLRALGKREMSEMSAMELVLLVLMGDMAQQGVMQDDMSVTGVVLAIGTIASWVLLFSYISYRFPRSSPVLDGWPVPVVRDGKPVMEVLRMERLQLDELLEAARNQGIADIAKVRLGILEADGRFSFLTNDETGKDHKQQPENPES